LEEITRIGAAGGWAVSAAIRRNGEDARIGTGFRRNETGEGSARTTRINGAPRGSPEAILEYLRVLWLTPAMDGLFTGPAGDRRRFLDRLVLAVYPGHGRLVRDFERLGTQRNRLLEENRAPAWLDALEAQLAEKAVALALARSETVALLSARIAAGAERDAAFPAGRIALSSEFDTALEGRSAAQAEIWYRDVLASSRTADRAAGRTLQGPNRSDLLVRFAEKDMPAALSSTGEQKALLIGLILAHAELVSAVSGMTPVLLLDEIAAHLDPGRRAALFARLAALGCQTFMTGTDPALFANLPGDAARFQVAGGRIAMVT
jgi:DNA replication and repair protein RecF